MDPATRRFLESGEGAGSHIGLIVRDDEYVADAVAAWSASALTSGGGVVLVGTARHLAAIRARIGSLGIDLGRHETDGRAVLLEAEWLLAKLTIDGTPERSAFRPLLDGILDAMTARVGSAERICAWGEMVSLLQNEGRAAAARQLEALWDEALAERGFRLLCSYQPMGPTVAPMPKLLDDVLATHPSVHTQPDVAP